MDLLTLHKDLFKIESQQFHSASLYTVLQMVLSFPTSFFQHYSKGPQSNSILLADPYRPLPGSE